MKIKILLFVLAGLTALFAFGPTADYPDIDPRVEPIHMALPELDRYIREREQQTPNLKDGNAARLIWADSMIKTPLSIVYLHGFSASPMEGNPLVFEMAERYDCNLFIARLAGHGLADEEAFLHLTPADLVNSAKEALAIGRLIGERVIVMSCSTGSTLSILLEAENPGLIDAQIMYSPNIDLYDGSADLLTMPWGLQLARWMLGSNYRNFNLPEACRQFWTMRYRLEGLICMKTLVEQTMKQNVFKNINAPYFIGYYYKNEDERDKIISVDAIRNYEKHTRTPVKERRVIAFSDVKSHVLLNDCQSHDLESVRSQTYLFAENILHLQTVTGH